MRTEAYCPTLNKLDRVKAIRAIQQAYLQLAALTAYADCGNYDNKPAMNALLACLRDAGHPVGTDYSAPEPYNDDPDGSPEQTAWLKAYSLGR